MSAVKPATPRDGVLQRAERPEIPWSFLEGCPGLEDLSSSIASKRRPMGSAAGNVVPERLGDAPGSSSNRVLIETAVFDGKALAGLDHERGIEPPVIGFEKRLFLINPDLAVQVVGTARARVAVYLSIGTPGAWTGAKTERETAGGDNVGVDVRWRRLHRSPRRSAAVATRHQCEGQGDYQKKGSNPHRWIVYPLQWAVEDPSRLVTSMGSGEKALHGELELGPRGPFDLDLIGHTAHEASSFGNHVGGFSTLPDLETDRPQLVPDIVLDKPAVVDDFATAIKDPRDRESSGVVVHRIPSG